MKTQLKHMQTLPPFTIKQRIQHLKKLRTAIKRNQSTILTAISADFSHRCQQESLLSEVMLCVDEINHTLRHLKQWTQPKVWHANWKFYPSKCAVIPEAKGVIGIMAPWNYPFNLVIEPLVAALAAGNRAMIKPSEITANTATMIAELLAQVFTEDEVHVVLGDVQVANDFSQLPLDHILFTGSTQVGKIVMRHASEHLTPLTLELGGKSPVLIDANYSLKKAAKSIVAGKFFNAGQTCVAPDYILIAPHRMDELVQQLKQQINNAYPAPGDNPDYTCVVNANHHQRLQQLTAGLPADSIIALGDTDHPQKIAPTLVLNPPADHPLMQQEIFGPVLPIISCPDLTAAIAHVNQGDKPLTMYLFSNNRQTIQQVREQTQSGSLSINETLVQFAQEGLPFGGIGLSGMGSYHGYQGFVSMSHMKSVYYQSRLNVNGLVRAPFTQIKKFFINLLNR